MRLILGSGSPRRVELLAQIGVVPDEIRPPDVDETPLAGELPHVYCARVTKLKAEATATPQGAVALCADTTVALGRRIMGKPSDRDEAARFLIALSGRRHRVITSVAVRNDARISCRTVTTQVKFKRLSQAEIDGYLATDDWVGKAGGYAIQGPASAFAPWIQGSFSAVVGLPLHETAELLQSAGYPLWRARP
ncbi:Septum formation protein Maf [Candidatus Rhodobacter oscarellae]|uniref:dTTP/UTP pyrophosphatase n=1 Tax=Candidatus Rhodobacter oscarellae TaxID=1675527 RepID=A0A0J9EB96_9RHOB|nr:Maf family protein [Candidatus Rhodobacter lobularis]KMW60055.1 Septum formation protein Maf [Candidatus Rhodobacter lobularis]